MATKGSKQMETREDARGGHAEACLQVSASMRAVGLRACGGKGFGQPGEAAGRRKENPVLMPVLFLPLFFLGSLLQASETRSAVQEWGLVRDRNALCQQHDDHRRWQCEIPQPESLLLSFQAFFQEQFGLSWNPGFKAVWPAGADWDGLRQAWFVFQRRYSSLKPVAYVHGEVSPLFGGVFSSLSEPFQEESEENAIDVVWEAETSWPASGSLATEILCCHVSGSCNIVYRLQNGAREATLPAYPF